MKFLRIFWEFSRKFLGNFSEFSRKFPENEILVWRFQIDIVTWKYKNFLICLNEMNSMIVLRSSVEYLRKHNLTIIRRLLHATFMCVGGCVWGFLWGTHWSSQWHVWACVWKRYRISRCFSRTVKNETNITHAWQNNMFWRKSLNFGKHT